MTQRIFLLTLFLLTTVYGSHAQKVYPGKVAKVEENIPVAFNHESKFIELGEHRIHYVESGQGDPVLLLHGIPSSNYIWRNVIDQIDDNKQVIALDWIGFGQSSFPEDRDASVEVQYKMLTDFIETKKLKNVTLWMHDLGSIVGMLYATRQAENVKAIALFEAPFMPGPYFYKQLPLTMKAIMKLTRKEERAEKLYVDKKFPGKRFPQVLTQRKLGEEEMAYYAAPFEDRERRYVMLNSVDPAQMSWEKGKGDSEIEHIFKEINPGMTATEIPILYFYAKKGLLNQKEAVEYARANFKNYQEVFVGKGKHYLTESHPQLMSEAFNAWYANLK